MGIKDFFQFLASNPNLIHTKQMDLRQRIYLVSKVLCSIYTIKLLFTILQITLLENKMVDDIKAVNISSTVLLEAGPILFLLQFPFLGPLLEELGFRAILQKGSVLTAAGVSSMVLVLIILLFKIPVYSIRGSSLLSISIACAFFLFLLKAPSILYNIMDIRNTHAQTLLWLNAIAFALWHYYNFDFEQTTAFSVAWYLTPHFITALILSWVSLKAGFFTACAVHICNNLLPAVFYIYANSD
ncbi:type II CAAX prenyl endopeptidase Rce1 family protein [Sphingobacterium bambusae]|uniref:Type II CAAX prenyl endopeptidase Rce1 family protein n=1 Tax=Sphingobacterium bambusae TaxID=662858 RepID=A0ABW6BGW0_9SPHI|nr:CPBP family glutamic-type intramembrane protease [Sphingobacterium bambusae]WPL49425.1 CPBP family glutamic-type intramembrane protease [Sphingobacterium bambusae]